MYSDLPADDWPAENAADTGNSVPTGGSVCEAEHDPPGAWPSPPCVELIFGRANVTCSATSMISHDWPIDGDFKNSALNTGFNRGYSVVQRVSSAVYNSLEYAGKRDIHTLMAKRLWRAAMIVK